MYENTFMRLFQRSPQSDNRFRPFFASSLIGIFNVAINIVLRNLYPLKPLTITALTLTSASALFYGCAVLYNSKVEQLLSKPRTHRRLQDNSLDDAELQRRQLLKLYMKRDSDRAPSIEMSRSTFRIDIPDPDGLSPEEGVVVITPPQNTYEGQIATPSSNYYSPYASFDGKQTLPSRSASPALSQSTARFSHSPQLDSKPIAELLP
jgi:hypothetical protein